MGIYTAPKNFCRKNTCEYIFWVRRHYDTCVRKYRTITGILRDTTHTRCHGSRMPWDERPRFCMSAETYIHRYNTNQLGHCSWNKKLWQQHLDKKRTLYFQGSVSDPFTMFSIDIDCKGGIGTKEGAAACAAHLSTKWPQIAWEVSTGGVGQHGYPFLARGGHSVEDINAAYKHFDAWLKQECQPFIDRGDISGIEIKGTLPVATFAKRKLIAYKFGVLCKMPRTITVDSLVKSLSTPLTVEELNALEIKEQPVKEPAIRITTKKEGSLGGCFGADIEHEVKALERVWMSQTDGEEIPTSQKYRTVSANEGAAICRAVLWCMENPNDQGTMPHARIMGVLKVWHGEGWIERTPCHHKVTAVRNWLSRNGNIDWIDNTYVYSDNLSGKAMQWGLSSAFANQCKQAMAQSIGGGTSVGILPKVIGPHEDMKPIGTAKPFLLNQRLWISGCELEKRLKAA